MNPLEFVIYILVAWRLTSLFVNEDGPWDILAKFRNRIGVRYDQDSQPYGTNVVASAFTCVWCASMWIAFPMALLSVVVYGGNLYHLFLNTFAFSAGAIIVNRWAEK